MSSTEFLRASAELAETVAALRSGEIGFVEGVRRVVSLRQQLRAKDFDPDFMIFVAVDSESDHLPNATAKLMASDEWLAMCEAEERQLQEQTGEAVLAAAERLLKRFANEA